jgi:hypothetical protein
MVDGVVRVTTGSGGTSLEPGAGGSGTGGSGTGGTGTGGSGTGGTGGGGTGGGGTGGTGGGNGTVVRAGATLSMLLSAGLETFLKNLFSFLLVLFVSSITCIP